MKHSHGTKELEKTIFRESGVCGIEKIAISGNPEYLHAEKAYDWEVLTQRMRLLRLDLLERRGTG